MEFVKLKSTIIEMKNSLQRLSSRVELVEERISVLEDRSILDLIKTENFCTSKDVIKRLKRQLTEWEKYLQIIFIIC